MHIYMCVCVCVHAYLLSVHMYLYVEREFFFRLLNLHVSFIYFFLIYYFFYHSHQVNGGQWSQCQLYFFYCYWLPSGLAYCICAQPLACMFCVFPSQTFSTDHLCSVGPCLSTPYFSINYFTSDAITSFFPFVD